MQTFNFDLRHIETALSMLKEIEECEYGYIVDLFGYLQAVEKYSSKFPNKFSFRLKDNRVDQEYDQVKDWLVKKGYFNYTQRKRTLFLTKKGKNFFKELEKKCLEVEDAFMHYSIARC